MKLPGPPPPRLHWTVVLLLAIVTLGLFLDIWLIVQALWVRKQDPKSRVLQLCILSIVVSILAEVLNAAHAPVELTGVVFVASLVLALIPTFAIRDMLAAYLTRLTGRPAYLGSFLTLILGPIYLQYHMNKVR
jgi:hypothetical protein